MYSNINTEHANEVIGKWFELHEEDLLQDFPRQLILDSLVRLMKVKVFTFGSRLFMQTNDTAMGTNAACVYATIYYSYDEENVNMKHLAIVFYRRLIDDAFIVMRDGYKNFEAVKATIDDFGPEGKRIECWLV